MRMEDVDDGIGRTGIEVAWLCAGLYMHSTWRFGHFEDSPIL